MEGTIYHLEDVSLFYPVEGRKRNRAVQNLNLDVKAGERIAVIGPSGCGKSTLLYLLAGLLKPSFGSVICKGRPLKGVNRDAALILQEYGLFPWKTVRENVSLGLFLNRKDRGIGRREILDRTSEIMEQLGIQKYGDRYPTQLSGGQKQRVAIARSLVMEPEILLMDEPFSSLDTVTRENLEQMILAVCEEKALTLVFVTHNMEEAVSLGQRAAVFEREGGSISRVIDGREHHGKEEFAAQLHRALRTGLSLEKERKLP